MRRKTVLLLLSLIVIAVGTASGEEGPIAHYSFDEGSGSVVRDLSGHGHHGTIHGAKYAQLEQGFALEFDGEDDYVEIPDAESLRLTGAVTVECWVNTPSNSGQTMVSKNGCSRLRQNYRLSVDQKSALFTLVECPEHGKTVSGGGVEPNSWYHLVGSYDGDKLRVYINGVQRGEQSNQPFSVGTLETPLYIGATFYGSGLAGHFTGQIDEVRVYGRALSEREVVASYEDQKDVRISRLDRLIAQTSSVKKSDTTPPMLNLAAPAPDTQVDGPLMISAQFADLGSGIDIASAQILLDGRDVTAQAAVSESGFSFTPSQILPAGIHQVEVNVSDRVGNLGNQLRWRFGVDMSVPVESHFDGDVFRLNGEPHFPVGIYSSNVSPTSKTPYFAQAAAAGINYKLIGERATDVLDDLLQHGMKGMVHVYYASLALGNGDSSALLEVVEQAKDHPATLGWWNEYASVNQSALATETYEFVRERDANHPLIYMLTWAGRLSDAYFVYAYPILNPLQPGDSITSIYDLVLKAAFEANEEEGKGKQVWFVSQAFDYRIDSNRGKIVTLEGGFRPSRQEIRAMNYFALTKGVKALLFYAPGSQIPATEYSDDVAIYPRQWAEVLKIASEVRYLAPTLAAGTQVETVELEQDGVAIHFTELSFGGKHTLIAVNTEPELVLAKWQFNRSVQAEMLFEDRLMDGESRTFTDLFRPLEVHIYQWSGAEE